MEKSFQRRVRLQRNRFAALRSDYAHDPVRAGLAASVIIHKD